ncbi:MAG TPA: head GIN domain-containing protein, partial [Burkholderiaceae bacterium]|nr:head GIN domain-containing protein [Burkholderiaceae bacterium]
PIEGLTLHTDDNIAPLVETSVDDGGVLHLGMRAGANFRTRHAIGATVEVKQLNSLKIFGPGDATCADLDADRIEITLAGPGDVHVESLHSASVVVRLQGGGSVRLSGTSAQQDYFIEGAGEVDADELVGRAVVVRAAGSGKAKIWATESLLVDINGSGDVRYRGQPALTSSVRGTGRLIHQ